MRRGARGTTPAAGSGPSREWVPLAQKGPVGQSRAGCMEKLRVQPRTCRWAGSRRLWVRGSGAAWPLPGAGQDRGGAARAQPREEEGCGLASNGAFPAAPLGGKLPRPRVLSLGRRGDWAGFLGLRQQAAQTRGFHSRHVLGAGGRGQGHGGATGSPRPVPRGWWSAATLGILGSSVHHLSACIAGPCCRDTVTLDWGPRHPHTNLIPTPRPRLRNRSGAAVLRPGSTPAPGDAVPPGLCLPSAGRGCGRPTLSAATAHGDTGTEQW